MTRHVTLNPADIAAAVACEPPVIRYEPTDAIQRTCDEIVERHRIRQSLVRARTRLVNQSKAMMRLFTWQDDDFDSDENKEKARARADKLYAVVAKDPEHALYPRVAPFIEAQKPLDAAINAVTKEMVAIAKTLPVYAWVKDVKYFGDVSFATIVGECGDMGSYKSVSAVWKRLGLAVIAGNRQGNPGKNATAEDWTLHGYNKQRRSTSYVASEQIIGGMGKYRPLFGEDTEANDDLTYYQKVFVRRVRYEAERLPHVDKKTGETVAVKCSDKGKESYTKHAARRAHRYTEKRLLRNLYLAWRRAEA